MSEPLKQKTFEVKFELPSGRFGLCHIKADSEEQARKIYLNSFKNADQKTKDFAKISIIKVEEIHE